MVKPRSCCCSEVCQLRSHYCLIVADDAETEATATVVIAGFVDGPAAAVAFEAA